MRMGQTDRQTEGQSENLMPPATTVAGAEASNG